MIEIYIVLIGVCMGSFIGAFHWRLHHKKNFTTERSMCESCKHTLAWYDLIPLLSWMCLRGKCRYCKKPIGMLAPLLELSTAALFLVSYILWPFTFSGLGEILYFVFWLVALTGLIILFVYDLRWFLLPDVIVFPLIVLAILSRGLDVLLHETTIMMAIGASIYGLLIGGGVFYVLYQISKGRWIGGGDVKLGFLLGIILGPFNAFLALMVAFYSASLFVLPLLATKRISRKTRIPFGPFLIFGLIIIQLYGESIHTIYIQYFGL